METRETDNSDKFLHFAVELLPAIQATIKLSEKIAESVKTQLLRLNSEFANYTPAERQLPQITLYSFADSDYFPVGVKHRYTRN